MLAMRLDPVLLMHSWPVWVNAASGLRFDGGIMKGCETGTKERHKKRRSQGTPKQSFTASLFLSPSHTSPVFSCMLIIRSHVQKSSSKCSCTCTEFHRNVGVHRIIILLFNISSFFGFPVARKINVFQWSFFVHWMEGEWLTAGGGREFGLSAKDKNCWNTILAIYQ